MTFQDPNDETMRNPDDPWQREWGTGSAILSLVAIVIIVGIVAYGAIIL